MNGASARRRPRRARVVPPDPNARALVIEREVTDDLDKQPWPPTGLGEGWHLVRSYPNCKRTFGDASDSHTRSHPARVTPFGDDMKGGHHGICKT